MSKCVRLTTMIGIGFFPLVGSAFGSLSQQSLSDRFFILFASVADTFHVVLVSHMFWHFLVYGRSIGFLVLLTLPWSIYLPSFRTQY